MTSQNGALLEMGGDEPESKVSFDTRCYQSTLVGMLHERHLKIKWTTYLLATCVGLRYTQWKYVFPRPMAPNDDTACAIHEHLSWVFKPESMPADLSLLLARGDHSLNGFLSYLCNCHLK